MWMFEGIKPSGCLSIKCEYEINISGFLSGITLNWILKKSLNTDGFTDVLKS